MNFFVLHQLYVSALFSHRQTYLLTITLSRLPIKHIQSDFFYKLVLY